MIQTAQTTETIAEWLKRETARIERDTREREDAEIAQAERTRLGNIERCNQLLQRWGVPVTIAHDDADFPVVTIGDHQFEYFGRGPNPYFRQLAFKSPDGEQLLYEDYISDRDTFIATLTGKYAPMPPRPQEPDEEELIAIPPKPAYPEVYRADIRSYPSQIQEYLNEQSAQGYEFHSMTPVGGNVYVVVKRSAA